MRWTRSVIQGWKKNEQKKWVGLMINVRSVAEEVVIKELVLYDGWKLDASYH